MALSNRNVGGLIGALLFCSMNASATTLEYKDFDQLVDEADTVVEGVVQSIDTKKNGREIYREVELASVSSFEDIGRVNGKNGAKFRIYGGQMDGTIMMAAGAPDFAPGDHVILFVKENGNWAVPFVGWEQGVFRVNELGEVADNEGNKVFGKSGKSLVKEKLRAPAANIIEIPQPTRPVNSIASGAVVENAVVAGIERRSSKSGDSPTLIWSDFRIDPPAPSAIDNGSVSPIALTADKFAEMVKDRKVFNSQKFGAHGPSDKADSLYALRSVVPSEHTFGSERDMAAAVVKASTGVVRPAQ